MIIKYQRNVFDEAWRNENIKHEDRDDEAETKGGVEEAGKHG